jgi:hypothetical protein
MALVTTFLTTPLTTILYPAWYQVKVARWRRGEIDWDGNPVQREGRTNSIALIKDQLKTVPVRKLLVYLRLDGLSGICTLAALLSPDREGASSPLIHPAKLPKQTEQSVEDAISPVENEDTTLRVHGVRLVELTDRDSSVMRVSAGDHALWDPVVNTFRAFGEWKDVALMAGVSVVPEHSYADTIIGMALQDTADLLLLPWSETGTLIDRQNGLEVDAAGRFANGPYTDFVANILERVPGHVGVLIENSPDSPRRPTTVRTASGLSIPGSTWSRSPTGKRSHHVVLPFLGGEDDRFALRLVLQLAQNEQVTATIIQIGGLQTNATKTAAPTAVSGFSKTPQDSQSDLVFFETLRDSVPRDLKERVVFEQSTQEGISDGSRLALAAVRKELDQISNKSGSIVVVGRRSSPNEPTSIDESIGSDSYRALGPVASAMVQLENKVFGSVLVLQAGVNTASIGDYRR